MIEENPDVYVCFSPNTSVLTVSLHKKWGGLYGNLRKNQKTTKVVWSGDTVLDFLITKKNDPNVIYGKFLCYIDDLVGSTVKYTLPFESKSFSIYTKRVMKKYALELGK